MIMYIFDAAEYTMDGITDPTDAEQIGFINELQHAKREIFSQRPGFYPACFGHVITESDPSVLTSLQIDGVSVWDAILNWFKTGSNASYMDSCTEAQCNPSCPAV
jgi:hypothetical protein